MYNASERKLPLTRFYWIWLSSVSQVSEASVPSYSYSYPEVQCVLMIQMVYPFVDLFFMILDKYANLCVTQKEAYLPWNKLHTNREGTLLLSRNTRSSRTLSPALRSVAVSKSIISQAPCIILKDYISLGVARARSYFSPPVAGDNSIDC
jgi:hypothetical protein